MTAEAMAAGSTEDLVAAARRAGVRDERVLAAIRQVPREGFVPHGNAAFVDRPIRTVHGQVTTQPSLVAMMVEALELDPVARVLEIGAGPGYQAAVLAQLAGRVWTVERFPDLADQARRNLDSAGIGNVTVVVGDGSLGLPEHAPYDAIIVAAAFPSVPAPLVDQLVVGGRLVQPLGHGGAEQVVVFERIPAGLRPLRTITGASFVRLYGTHGYSE